MTVRRWLISIFVFLVLVAAVVGAAFVYQSRTEFQVEDVPPAARPTPALAAAEGSDPAGTSGADNLPNIAAAVAAAAKDPALGTLSAQVTDLATGTVAWEMNPRQPLVPASATKIMTGAAALLGLNPAQRLPTAVVQTSPDSLAIIGSGDVTLSRSGDGFYTDAASLADLAEQVRARLTSAGETPAAIRRIQVDNSVRGGDVFNGTWDREDIAMGNVADVDSVMLDGGRIDAKQPDSPRSITPAEDVARVFADLLGVAGETRDGGKDRDKIEVTMSDTPVAPELLGTQAELGRVYSAPLATRLRDMLRESDNISAEAIGRELATTRTTGQGETTSTTSVTFAEATEAILATLREAGFDVDGMNGEDKAVLHDSSGMSKDNRLTAHILDAVLSDERIRLLLDDLPVAGVDGTLSERYGPGSGAESAAGWVRAKTGTLDGVNALAGTVTTSAGRALSFAFLSNGSHAGIARPALDRLANALRAAR